jgi:hypothetical protein
VLCVVVELCLDVAVAVVVVVVCFDHYSI